MNKQHFKKALCITLAAVLLAANVSAGKRLGKTEQIMGGSGIAVVEAQETSAEIQETQVSALSVAPALAGLGAENVSGADAAPESESESESEAKTGSESDSEAGAGSASGSENEADAENGSEGESGMDDGNESESESAAGVGSESGADAGNESESESAAGVGSESEADAGSESGSENESGAENESESESEDGADAGSACESESEADNGSASDVGSGSESGGESGIEWSTEDGAELDFTGTSLAPTASYGTEMLDVAYTYIAPGAAAEITVSAAEVVDAGTYTATAEASDAVSSSITFKIIKMPLALQLNSAGAEYSGSAIDLPNACVEFPDGTTAEGSCSTGEECMTSVTDAGEYALSVDLTEIEKYMDANYGDFYTVEETVFTFTVTKAAVASILWEYQGSEALEAVYDADTLISPDSISAAFAGADGGICGMDVTVTPPDGVSFVDGRISHAGDYALTASLTGEQAVNYELADGLDVTNTFTVKRQEIADEVQWSEETLFYNQTYQHPAATVSGVAGELLCYTVSDEDGEAVDETEAVIPGITYTVTVSCADYILSGAAKTFVIEKAQVTSLVWEYNGSAVLEETYSECAIDTALLKAKYTGCDGSTILYAFVSITPPAGVSLDGDGNIIAAGAYGLSARINDSEDAFYELADNAVDASTIFTVSKMQIPVSWSETAEFTYDQTAHQRTATVEDAGYVLSYSFEKGAVNAEAADGMDWTELDAAPSEPGTYRVKAAAVSGPADADSKELTNTAAVFTIVTYPVTAFIWYRSGDALSGNETSDVYKNAAFELLTAEFMLTDEIAVTADVAITGYTAPDGTEAAAESIPAEIKDAGTYILTASVRPEDVERYEISADCAFTVAVFTVRPLEIALTANDQSVYYQETKPTWPEGTAEDYTIAGIPSEDTNVKEADVRSALEVTLAIDEKDVAGCVDVGTYSVIKLTADQIGANYRITAMNTGSLTIRPLPVTVTPASGQWKYYSAAEPAHYEYEVAIGTDSAGNTAATELSAAAIKSELNSRNDGGILKRVSGESAGTYAYALANEDGGYGNFRLTLAGAAGISFEIRKLPVTIVPDEGQKKIFGEKEPDVYPYAVKIGTDDAGMTKKAVKSELGEYVLSREPGEAIGTYAYEICADQEDADIGFNNYELKVAADASDFEIEPVTITGVESITSRQEVFKVTTNLEGERQAGVKTKVKIEALEFPVSADGIQFSDNLEDYIPGAAGGLSFSGSKSTVSVNSVTYRKKRTGSKKMADWSGYLPAGLRLRISIVDGDGNTVSADSADVTVSAVAVSFDWGETALSVTGDRYVTSRNGKAEALTLSVNGESGAGELAELAYRPAKGQGSVTYSYETLNLTYEPKANTAGSEHVMQSITASLVDTLNLTAEAKTLDFYVDDQAHGIPAASISCENRGNEITIRLPEPGMVTSVELEGAAIEVNDDTAGTEKTFAMGFSGEALISSGTAVTVTYTDQAGHQGSGSGTVSRSSVSTPITFTIRPELNPAGYLNGKSTTLIISGTACACEPVTVTAAGSSQTAYAAVSEVWSDENEAWEALVYMSDLPENEAFTISAEYTDVSGQGCSMTASYDEFCSPAVLLSPVCEAMTAVSGLAEPGTAAALIFDGNRYEMTVDSYGHFWLDEVPMMFAGEDSFDIYVADIAGNEAVTHYELQEADEITSDLSPLGTFFYSGDAAEAHGYLVLPVSASDFRTAEEGEEEPEKMELPLLLGTAYVAGTVTVSRTEEGIVVTSELELEDAGIHPEDYHLESQPLLVFTSEPSVRELREIEAASQAGEASAAKLDEVFRSYANVYEAGYGEEIPLKGEEAVWIMNRQQISILTDVIGNLERYAYDLAEDEMYEFYQMYPGKQAS